MKIDFNNNTNVIIGENNKGKSSIIRALYWVFTNRPSGDWMRTIISKDKLATTSVKIVLDNDRCITRKKGDNFNGYYLDDEKFQNAGREVPIPIKEVLGLIRINIRNKEFYPSLAPQDELPFLIFESGPTRGGILNYLTGIDVADNIKRDLSNEILGMTKDINKNIEALKELKTSQINIDDLNEVHRRFCLLVEINKKYNKFKKLDIKLSDLFYKYKVHSTLIKKLNGVTKYSIQFNNTVSDLENKGNRLKELNRLRTRYESVATFIMLFKKVDSFTEYKDGINKKIKEYEQKQETLNLLKVLSLKITKIKNEIKEMGIRIDVNQKKLNKYDGEVCPICQNRISLDTVK